MINITPTLSIDESEIHLQFVWASGPGGQNVNKVATAVRLRFDVGNSPSILSVRDFQKGSYADGHEDYWVLLSTERIAPTLPWAA